MANETPILAEGYVPTKSTSIFAPSVNQVAEVSNIRIVPKDSSQNYTIELFILIPGVQNSFPIFNLSLDAGDWVNDDTAYFLSSGSKIMAICNRTDFVSFVINGELKTTVTQPIPK